MPHNKQFVKLFLFNSIWIIGFVLAHLLGEYTGWP
jgi:hypothetical protein